MNALLSDYFLPCLWASLASAGFGLIFNIHGRGLTICAFGAGLGWLVYLLALDAWGQDIFAAFLAAIVCGFYSEIMARLRRCPVTGYLLVALLPLVPGAGVYYAMQYCVQGENERFLTTLLHTFGMAAALSVGAMLVTSVLRALLPKFHRAIH